MLKYNQKAAAHKNSKADYLLTEKLFCGKCGAMMVGVSGTSHTGSRRHYYYCMQQRKKNCDKKPVRRVWVEDLVLSHVIPLIRNEDLLGFIAESTYQNYLVQNMESAYTESLRKTLAERKSHSQFAPGNRGWDIQRRNKTTHGRTGRTKSGAPKRTGGGEAEGGPGADIRAYSLFPAQVC